MSVEGCLYIGAYTRVFIYQRDDERGICARLVLVSPEDYESPFDLTGLTVPPDWTVDETSAFPCTPDGSMLSGATPNYYMTASGSVDFVMGQGGMPTRASVEVTLANPLADAAASPDPLITGQQISARDLELLGSCPLR
jgi:hypothetical protein